MKSEIHDANEMEYIIFCIENTAAELGVSAEVRYHALTEKSDILDRYIIPNYEILHTQDKGYIVDDILSVMQEEGVQV